MASPLTARQLVFPDITTGIGAALAAGGALAYGNWVDVALLAAITQNTSVYGIVVDTPSAAEIFTIDIGSCEGYANAAALIAGGAGAIAAAHRVETRIAVEVVGGAEVPVYFPEPIIIASGIGILARMYNVGGAATINVSVLCLQGTP